LRFELGELVMASIAISSQPRRSSDSCSLPRASRTHPHMSPSPNSQSLALARLSTCAARRLAPLGDGPPPPMGQAVVSPSFPNALGLVVDLRSSLAPSRPCFGSHLIYCASSPPGFRRTWLSPVAPARSTSGCEVCPLLLPHPVLLR
jgi:hypothetical protein